MNKVYTGESGPIRKKRQKEPFFHSKEMNQMCPGTWKERKKKPLNNFSAAWLNQIDWKRIQYMLKNKIEILDNLYINQYESLRLFLTNLILE